MRSFSITTLFYKENVNTPTANKVGLISRCFALLKISSISQMSRKDSDLYDTELFQGKAADQLEIERKELVLKEEKTVTGD